MNQTHIPVIAIDGPSGSGKGTLCRLLAQHLGWHMLDSGAIYRLLALAAQKHHVAVDNETELAKLAEQLAINFQLDSENELQIMLEGNDVTLALRTEECGKMASQISSFPLVRAALLDKQRAFRQAPGLVTDGRDMGTVVFPEADLKIFLLASAEKRAERRYKQLKNKELSANLSAILEELQARDKRDSERSVAPLKPATDSILLDSDNLSIDEVFNKVLDLIREKGLLQN